MKKYKLIYILPEYNNNLDWHIFYLANFIESIWKDLDIFVIIEKSKEKDVNIKNISWFYGQKCSNILLRSIELFFVVLWKRICWYRKVYIHYSYIWAIFSSIIMRLTFWKTFYWNCWMMWLFKNKKQFLLRISLKIVNYLVTWVNALKKWYSENYWISENKILIMPNWIELNRVKSVKNNMDILFEKEKLWFTNNDKIILFIHRLAERKWIHYVSKIAKEFNDNKNIKFLIIWDWPYKKKLLEEIYNSEWNNIKYIWKVSNKEIYKYFLLSDVFLMPSEEEWFPRVLLESMACGIPYVASDIWWVREISPSYQQKYIYKIWDIRLFRNWIEKLLTKKIDFTNYINKYDICEVKEIFLELINR